MAQIILWLLRKVASTAVEAVFVDVVKGRVRRALPAPRENQRPVAELPAGEPDPAVLLIAEMIATALEQQGLTAREAILADGRAHPNISILVVAHEARQNEIVDATVVPAPPPPDEIADAA
jgi:hypothetical protein